MIRNTLMIFWFLLVVSPTSAFAQAAWGYLELPHAASSLKAGDRWDAGTVAWNESESGTLTFVVPPELVAGRHVEVSLTPTSPAAAGEGNAFVTYAGPLGEAVCTRDGVAETCLLRLSGLGVTAEEAEAYLDRTLGERPKHRAQSARAEEFLAGPVLRYWHGIQ